MDQNRRSLIKGAAITAVTAVIGNSVFTSNAMAQTKETHMKKLKFYLDTHDKEKETFPANLSPEQFEQFYAKYKEACYAEGVIPIRLHVGYEKGRAFCLTMAPDEDSVRRAHERTGLPFDSITEVSMATPGDSFFRGPE